MNETGLLLVLSGPSGVGKGTIAAALLREMPGMRLSISATTRPPRRGDVDGVNYHFLRPAEFEKLIKDEQLLEWAQVYGNYYGTQRQYVTKALKKGEDVLLEIDTQGALQVKQKLPEAVLVYIAPPTKAELRQRLTGRATDAPMEIEKRLNCSINEMKFAEEYDYIVVNDNVELAVQKIRSIMTAEKLRSQYQSAFVKDFDI